MIFGDGIDNVRFGKYHFTYHFNRYQKLKNPIPVANITITGKLKIQFELKAASKKRKGGATAAVAKDQSHLTPVNARK